MYGLKKLILTGGVIVGSHVVVLKIVVCRWSRFPRSACHGSVDSGLRCSFFKFLCCSTCAPGSCPCLPRPTRTQAAYLLHFLLRDYSGFIFTLFMGDCITLRDFFPLCLVLWRRSTVCFILLLLRGIMTMLGLADWVSGFFCDLIIWVMGGSWAGGDT